jgi:hypothetical protein
VRELEGYLDGELRPSPHEFNLMTAALNEQFADTEVRQFVPVRQRCQSGSKSLTILTCLSNSRLGQPAAAAKAHVVVARPKLIETARSDSPSFVSTDAVVVVTDRDCVDSARR